MQELTLTVSELNEYVRRMLAGDPMLRSLSLRGEISNFKRHVSGHWYFTLKDEQSRINCVLFRQNTLRVRCQPRDGMRVVLAGAAGLYTQSGSYQFYADNMREDGVGELYLRFLELKERLTREGLFDALRKRPLPLLPRGVGVVTSRTGAVLHDIFTVANRRFPGIPIILRASQVQGEGAAEDLVRGLQELSQSGKADVIIIGRGGGSLEDLWPFNEEIVARAVAACPIPVISAVGHETDVTLCDFASDVRAATPSAAAEMAVPERAALLRTVNDLHSALRRGAESALSQRAAGLAGIEKRLQAQHPASRLQTMQNTAAASVSRLRELAEKQTAAIAARVALLAGRLRALGPVQALSRGYAIVLKNGVPVTAVEAASGDLMLLLSDGRAHIRVLDTERGDPFGS